MKIAVLVLCCVVGMVVSEPCSHSDDCSLTTCQTNFNRVCLDNFCVCLSPATGIPCGGDDECEQAGGSEHCYNDREWDWKCKDGECYCKG
ncbi:hypothetical protein ACF0H5_013339 [Mactra antiquata]